MKRIITTAVSAFIAILTLTLQGCIMSQTLPKMDYSAHYDVNSFEAINIGGAFEIRFVESDSNYVNIVSDVDLTDILYVGVEQNTLNIHPKKDYRGNDEDIVVTIGAHTLSAISLSGANKLTECNIENDKNVKISLSGASTILASITCNSLEIVGNGATDIRGTFNSRTNADFIFSGASKANMEVNADDITLKCSGAVTCNATVNANRLTSNSNGACTMTLRGQCTESSINSSGACTIHTEELRR